MPGNRVLLRGAQQPVAGGLLARRAQGRGGRRHHDGCPAGGARSPHCRACPARRSPWSTTGSPRTCKPSAPRPARTSTVVAVRRRRRPTTWSRGARPSPASSPPWRRPPTTSPCSGRPRARTGAPKITMHFHRDIALDRRHLRPAPRAAASPTTSSPCTAPLAFTFGLGGLVVFPLRAGACALLTEKATPPELRPARRTTHGVTVLSTAPTAYRPILKDGHAGLLHGLRTAVCAGEHLTRDTWQAVLRRRPGCGSSTASAPPSCCTSSSPRAGDDIRRGATGTAGPRVPRDDPRRGRRGGRARRRPVGSL